MYETEQISRTGYNKLMEELNQLEKVELPQVRQTVGQHGNSFYGCSKKGMKCLIHPWQLNFFYDLSVKLSTFRKECIFMNQLKETYTVRPAVEDDIEVLLEIFNQYWEVLTGMVKFTLEDFQNIFSTPGFDFESSTQVIIFPNGEVVACGLVMDLASPPVHPSLYGAVRQGSGLRAET